MRTAVAVTLIVCGTTLGLMPGVHHSVVVANQEYGAGMRGQAGVVSENLPGYVYPVIFTMGGTMIVAGLIGGAMNRLRQGERESVQ